MFPSILGKPSRAKACSNGKQKRNFVPDVLHITIEERVAAVTLARPEVRNAFNAQLIAELREAFERLAYDASVRAIVLRGEGAAFCGGADINWMRSALDLSYDENLDDADAMSRMFRAIDGCSKPVVARVTGAALGGGAGLVAACDVAIAAQDATFGFTEVKLGILPAVISPFVIAKIGVSHARALFLTGERFGADRARDIGLVHRVTPLDAIDDALDEVLAELKTSSPGGMAAAKALVASVRDASYDETQALTTSAIARQRVSEEGQEGLRAFLERRPANFAR